MDRKKKNKNSSLYLGICACLVVMAMVGYAGRMSLEEKEEEIQAPVEEVTPDEQVKQTTQKTEVEVPDDQQDAEADETLEEAPVSETIEFQAPVKGKAIEGYMGDDLVYNESLKDWRTHKGVDFEAEMGEEVKVSAPGVVEKVFDSELGRCIVVDHKNGFCTMYANLEEDTQVKVGDEVKAGDVIGRVGNTALGDMTDLPHLHFEMIKDGNCVNPTEILN